MTNTTDWPEALTGYKRTPEFTEVSVPKALLRAHSTKDGVWGKLHVLEGVLNFFDEVTGDKSILHPGIHCCIFPLRMHHIAPDGPVRFFVEFCRIDEKNSEMPPEVIQNNAFPHR